MSHSNKKKFEWVKGLGINVHSEPCSPTAQFWTITIHTGDSFTLVVNPTEMLDPIQLKRTMNIISRRILKMYDGSIKGGRKR